MIDTATGCLVDAPSNELSLTEVLARNKPTDKAQRRFRKLVTQIERLRGRLTQWESYTHRYNQRVTGELHPLQEQLRAARKQMAQLIDELLSVPTRGRRLGKVQRSKLTHILTQLVEDLLQEADDDTLRALRDKHRTPVDEDRQLFQTEATREILREVTGLDVDSSEARTPEEFLEHVRRLMEEPNDDSLRSDQRHRGRDRGARTESDRTTGQTRSGQATRQINQSLREVFRKLVSALHPDREPDAAERQRKNELMQRVNRAYEANDLLTLLGLQLEIEQIDAAHLTSLSSERLAQYTQTLREQLANLQAELERSVQPFLLAMGHRNIDRLTPDDVDRELSADIAQLRITLRQLQDDMIAFRDPHRLRKSLAEFELETFGPSDDLEELAALMGSFPVRPRGRRRRR